MSHQSNVSSFYNPISKTDLVWMRKYYVESRTKISITKQNKDKLIRLFTSCVGTVFTEGQIGEIAVTGIRGRRSKQLLYDLQKTRGYWKLNEEALDRTVVKSL